MRKKLKEVCDFYSGTGFPVKYQGEDNGELPFYKVGDIANNAVAGNVYLSLCNNFISHGVAKEIRGTIIPADVVVFAKIGEALKLNRRAITSCDCLIDNNAMGIGAKSEYLNSMYFYFFMKNLKMENLAESTTVPSVRKTKLEEMEMEVPAFDEQSEIVDILAKLQKVINYRQEQLVKLDELIKARFVEMFDGKYPEDTLLNLCNIIDYRGKTPEKVECGLPFITAKNVKMHHMTLEPREYISKETYDKVMVRGFPKEGDVVFTTEAPLGNVCRIPHFDTEFYIGQRIVTIQTDALNPTYLEYTLSDEEFVRKYMGKSSGSTVTGIRVRLLEQLTIPVPPRTLQDEFSIFVEQVDKSKFVYY